MKPTAPHSSVNTHSGLLKGLAGLQLLLAIGRYAASGDAWLAVSTTVALSLAMILFSRETINDERVEQLKLKAMRYGLVGGLLVITSFNLGGRVLRSRSPSWSPFDGLIVVLGIALALFHYWRWQDGQPGGTDA